MLFQEHEPHPSLRRYVQLIWCLEQDGSDEDGPVERIVPDGIVELVFHYRDPVMIRRAGEGPWQQPRSSLVSQTRRWLEFSSRAPTGFVSVRFRPWGAHHFLGLPVSALADRVVDAVEVWGPEIHRVEERLSLAGGVTARVEVVETFLQTQLARHHKLEIEPLVRKIWQARGRLKVADFCAEFGLGERRAQRLFAACLGLPPKRFARLTRFLHACSLLRDGVARRQVETAVECGYYDQAHFVAEVRSFSGLTPTELIVAPALSFLKIE